MRSSKQTMIGIAAVIVVVLLLVGGAGVVGATASQPASTAPAVTAAPTPQPPATQPPAQGGVSDLLARVAKILGIDEQKLKDAFKQAGKDVVDEAANNGKLSEDQANKLKDRVDKGDVPNLGLRGKWGFPGLGDKMPKGPGGMMVPFAHMNVLDAAAKVLGTTRDDIATQSRDGKSLAEIAAAKNVTRQALIDGIVKEMTATIQSKADAEIKALPDDVGKLVDAKNSRRVTGTDATAKLLGMTTADLRDQIRQGKTLAEIAATKNISRQALIDGIVKNLTENIQADAQSQIKNLSDTVGKAVDAKGVRMFQERPNGRNNGKPAQPNPSSQQS